MQSFLKIYEPSVCPTKNEYAQLQAAVGGVE